jgi:small-conductance mechanosensitive channel
MILEAMMNNVIDLTPLFAALFEFQKYFVTRILVWNMLVQLIVVGCMVLLARGAAAVVRPWLTCLLMGFGDSAVNFELRIWIQDPQNGIHAVQSQVLLGVWKRFQQHGIELPFPQRVLHHKFLPELEVAVRPRTAAADSEIDRLQPV